MDLTSLKRYLSTAVKILPKPLRYSIRSYARLHEDILHPELKLIDFHTGSPIIFDVGANIGGFVGDLMLRAPLARFHCFEPHPEIFEALKRNCVKYGMLDNKPRAIANNFALGSREETKEFILTDMSVCSSFLNRLINIAPGRVNGAKPRIKPSSKPKLCAITPWPTKLRMQSSSK
jgi:hypothetical protein